MTEFPNLKLDHQLCFALYAATNAITRVYRTRLSSVGLTYSQYLVMMALWEEDRMTVRQIALRLQLDSAMLTPLLKRLESSGYITRVRGSLDQRVVRIHLTDAGSQIQAQVAKIQSSVECQTHLEHAEFIALRTTLHQLTETLNLDRLSSADKAA
jgi:DNA-binding MarR family transcriptional regulator